MDDQALVFIGGASFGGEAGQLRFAGGTLEGDLNCDGLADFQIDLNGLALLFAASLLL